ncbi:IPExxxVDY family protein [uncultured Maribacter sp.]|uniref:IPExxxVDY family protein n=1 Tax=uncultured Maribacter sp. TaxID=431308 RepID=UPI002609FB41|nr:IPExxxVDY family protein [uncultured Maribacter sp.]
MVAVHKITGDFFEEAFILIALHSSLPDYNLVYEINNCLKANFKRSRKDLDISNTVSFPFFEWEDEINDRYWTLISNNSKKEESTVSTNLFKDEPAFTTHHLIPEHKEIDYFLKIEEDEAQMVDTILKALVTIPKIITAYEIDAENLKSKNNLIF